MKAGTRGALAALVAVAVALAPTAVSATAKAFGFDDVSESEVHGANIEWAKANGITAGCNPEGTNFCPDDNVLRKQMVSFMRNLDNKVAGDIQAASDALQSQVDANNAAIGDSADLLRFAPADTFVLDNTSTPYDGPASFANDDSVLLRFGLPPSYVPGTPITMDILFLSNGSACTVGLSDTSAAMVLADGTVISGATGSITTPGNVIELGAGVGKLVTFDLTFDPAEDQPAPGAAVRAQFVRDGGINDTCTDPISVLNPTAYFPS